MKKCIGTILLMCCFTNATEISFTVEAPLAQLSLVPKDTFTMVSIGGFEYEQRFGAPMLPIISKKFCIPTNEAVVSYNIVAIDSVVLPGQYLVFPAQPPEPLQGGVFYPPDSTIYNATSPFPGEIISYSAPHYMSGIKLTDVLIYPIKYWPALRKLILYTHLEINIILESSTSNACTIERRSFEQHRDIIDVAKIAVDNPDQVEFFTISPPIVPNSAFPYRQWPPGPWTFVIITTGNMQDEFDVLAQWRIEKGLRTQIVTREWINDNFTGVDIQEKIRNFIKDAYSRLGTQYVLIGGDQELIPTRLAYCGTGDPSQDDVPSDLYYSDLEGWWDGDWEGSGPAADGIFCWFYLDPFLTDSVDFTPDVSVGRISVSTTDEAGQFIDKLLTYERTPSDEYSGIADFLLLGANMNLQEHRVSGGEIKDSCIADISPIVNVFGLYDDEYHGWTPHNRIGRQPCLDYISNGFYLINHMGHGWITHIYIGPDGPYSEELIYRDVQDLTNVQKCSFMYSLSCRSADFWSAQDCLGECWLSAFQGADQQGLIAYLGHTKCGWFYWHAPGTSPSAILDRYFFRILTHCEHPRRGTNIIGLALSLAKTDLPHGFWWLDLSRYELTSLNALADPTTPVWICKPSKITASHPLTIPVNLPIDLSVTVVDENELPVVNAVVCLNKIDDIYEIETTNTAGEATFHITANSIGPISVTASKTMYIPYQGEIQVFEFEVDIPIAHTSYSEGRKIVRKPGTEELYLGYTFLDFPGANGPDDWATYSFSPDGGSSWEEGQNIKRFTRNPSIGLTSQLSGYHPCVAYRNSYEPYLVDQPAVIYFARYDDPNWVLYTIDSFPVVGIFHPSVSPPSIVVDANDICHMVYSGVLYAPGKAYVVYKRFDTFNPGTETVIIDSAIVPEDWEPSSPCISTQLGFPHIVYDFPPEAGEPYPDIWYRCLTETGWSNKINISNSYSLPSEHPFIYLTNEKAVVVWCEEEDVGNEESREIWKGERFLNHPPEDWTIWREVETPNQASDWPIITANNNFLIWSEHIFIDTEQNWEVLYQSPPHGSESISKSPYTTKSLYPSCAWRQTTEELNLYTAFTEHYEYEPNPYIFGIRIVKNSFPGTPVPRYTIFGGNEIPSLYCVERDGYIAYDDYSVDYDTSELIYKFTNLDPDLKYKIDVTVYHEFSGEWREWIKIDNTAQHLIKYEAGEAKTVEFHVPPAAYKDGEIIVKITKIQGDFAMLHLSNLYEFEKKGGGGGPQATIATSLPLAFALSVLPNIISRSARLQYTIPEKQRVTLNLYDIVGRRVVSITDGVIEPGIYNYYLNSTKLSQGIYFLILEGEKENKRQKILIVR